MDLLYFVLLIVMVCSIVAQGKVQRTFNKYANTPVSSGKSADQIAGELLYRGGSNVQITAVQGSLTDHFNSKTGVVGLSQSVYGSNSVAAVAVAAHEIGHVMQYQEGYSPIRFRNAILPVASIGSNLAPWIVIAGLLLFNSYNVAMIGVVLFGAALLFQLVTLPVEFNASGRALQMLQEGGYISYDQTDEAKKVLRAAAMTYVWAAIAALVSFVRLFLIASSARRRD